MMSMDIRQCLDHMDTRRVITALQSPHLPRWLVRGFARDLCHLKAMARIADAISISVKVEEQGASIHMHYSTNSSSTTSQHSRTSGTRKKLGASSAMTKR